MNTAFGIPGFSRDILALFSHRVILRLAFGLTNAFTGVFFYEIFNNSIPAALSVFLVSFVLTVLFTPLSARLLSIVGVRALILAAIPFLFLAFFAAFMLAQNVLSISPLLAAGVYAFGVAAYKSLYWVPYHIGVASAMERGGVGRQLAIAYNASDLLEVAMPLLGGFLLAGLGYQPLFALALAIIFLSVIPLFGLSTRYETFQWGYSETFRHIFARKNRSLFIAHFSEGVETTVLITVWPLFIFVLFLNEYEVLGAVTTLTFLAVLLLRMGTGYLMDRWNKKRVMYWGAVFAAGGWILKLFVGTPVQIVAVDTFHGFGRVVQQTAFATLTYEQAADNGTYIDEYTVFKEIALHCGRIVMVLAVILALLWLGTAAALIVALVAAAAASFATMYLSQRGAVC